MLRDDPAILGASTFLAHPASAAFPDLATVAAQARDRLRDRGADTALAYPAFPAPGATPVAAPAGWLPDGD